MAQAQRTVASGSRAMKSEVKALQLTFADVATASSRAWRVFLGGAAIIGTAKTIISVTDAFKSLQAQLRLATSQYGSFEQANKDVQAIAARSRSDLLSTAELYATLQRNADQFGGSQQQVARITETVTKAFKISGATADEASNATRQLVQAFQSGRLQGDEFRSMMENAPRLARLLADSLGITVGQLRQMSKEGQLTADVLARAFSDKRFTASIDEEFRQLPVTFDQAMNQLYNAAVLTFGEFDQGGQFSTALSNFIVGGTQGFADLADSAYKFGAETRGILDGLDAVKAGIGSMSTEGIRGMLGIEDATISLREVIGSLLGVIDGVANAFANLINAPGNLIRAVTGVGGAIINNPSNLAGGFYAAHDKALMDSTRRKIMGRGASDVFAELGMGRKVPAFHPTPTGDKKKKAKKGPQDRSADVEAQFDQELRQADMEILRARQDLTHNSEARAAVEIQLLALEEENEKATLDDKVRRAKKDLADGRITQSAFDQVEADAKILESKNAEVTRLKTQAVLDEVAHQRAEDAANLEQTNFDIQRDALQAQEDLATTAAERRDIELRLLDLSYRQEKARLDAVIADETSSEAAKEEARRRLAGLNAGFAAKQAGVMQSTAGPLEQWARSIPKTAAEINEAIDSNIADSLTNAADAAGELTKQIIGMKGPVADLAASFAVLAAKMLIMQGMKALFPSLFGGSLSAGVDGSSFASFEATSGGGGFGIPGFASGGAFTIMGNRGVDKNQLSLNGLPIANVSYGERLSIANDNGGGGGGDVTIHQHYSFSGVAVTKDEFVSGLMFAKHDTIATIKDMNRRGRR